MKPTHRRLKRLSRQAQWRSRSQFVVNSDFDNPAIWTKGDGWSIGGDVKVWIAGFPN